jgi:hypothetical protein
MLSWDNTKGETTDFVIFLSHLNDFFDFNDLKVIKVIHFVPDIRCTCRALTSKNTLIKYLTMICFIKL